MLLIHETGLQIIKTERDVFYFVTTPSTRRYVVVPRKAQQAMEQKTYFEPNIGGETQEVWSFFDQYKVSGVGEATPRPNIDSFSHVTEESKERDKHLLERKMKNPTLREQVLSGPDAFAFENFLTTNTKKYNWLGGEITPTTEYDDWISGSDAIIEWVGLDNQPIRLAVDFTASITYDVFAKKTEKLEGNVSIKYLRSKVEKEDGKPKEMRVSVPLVILGFDNVIYQAIAEQNQPMSSNHPIRLLLLQQASPQIDIQIFFLVEKIFTSNRAKRDKGRGDSQEKFKALGNEFTAEQAAQLIHNLDEAVIDAVMKPKTKKRLLDLIAIKALIDKESKQAGETPLSDTWQRLATASVTHQILSGK